MLQLDHVSLTVEGVPLLNDISFTVKSGEVVAVIGPNGAGKTSLLNAIGGQLDYQGDINLAGQSLQRLPLRQRAKQLAVLPQRSSLSFDFSAKDVVSMGRLPHSSGLQVDLSVVDDVMQRLDIEYLATRAYTRLSGGEQQRVQLARVLVQIWRKQDACHRVLLLDEPTAALDIAHQHQLMSLIQHVAEQGVAVVVVLHDFNLAARYAHRIAVLRCGELVACDAVDNVLTAELFRQVFGVKAHLMPHPSQRYPVMVIDQ